MSSMRFGMLLVLVMVMLTAPALALQVGDVAPDFTLTDTNGIEHTLSDYQGKVVFFNFMGCT
jgi:peroxiredoxin